MKIKFTPMRHDDRLELWVSGDTLIINGEAFDFGAIPEGASLPCGAVACSWLVSDVERIGGEIELTLILPHDANAPPETRNPEPVHVKDGLVPVPHFDAGYAQ
ncbi:hypothetical protein [Ruegeria sp. PrR005]|nr:hypothetical protein [Ruegeria sp. PrR005]